MTPAARVSAAIEVLADIATRRRPAADALKDWGIAHRFAGSGDRAAIAGLTYDALRRRASPASSWAPTRRARWCSACCGSSAISMPPRSRGLPTVPATRRHRSPTRSARDSKRQASTARRRGWPATIPNGSIRISPRAFGDERAEEGAALSSRAPLDLRVNTLKGTREEAASALADLAPAPTRWSPVGLRIALSADAKSPAIHAEPAFIKGLVEVQDEGSQLAALLAGAKPGEQVVDLCAGAGGKTLALAAAMENRGQLYATDADKRRLAPIHARLERAGARNVQVRTPRGDDRRARRSRWPRRPGADRRALHRHRLLAAQSRRQMAGAARARSSCGARSRRRCSTARPRWSSPAAASPM